MMLEDPADQLALLKAVLEYDADATLPNLKRYLCVIFRLMQPTIDAARSKTKNVEIPYKSNKNQESHFFSVDTPDNSNIYISDFPSKGDHYIFHSSPSAFIPPAADEVDKYCKDQQLLHAYTATSVPDTLDALLLSEEV